MPEINYLDNSSRVTQLVAYKLGTPEVGGSNPGKEELFIDALLRRANIKKLFEQNFAWPFEMCISIQMF